MVNVGAAGGTAAAPKRRNSEKKKEKSRHAARCRRSKESEIFSQLAETLPLPKNVIGQLDKASIMRLVISCLKLVRVMKSPVLTVVKADEEEERLNPSLLRALEGFLLVISGEGDMVFLSENVTRYLGLTQIELMGHSIFEFSHPCDHEEIKEMLTLKCNRTTSTSSSALTRSFFFRMKCTLTTKGRNVNLKSASYKVIHCIGKMCSKNQKSSSVKLEDVEEEKEEKKSERVMMGEEEEYCLVAVAQPIVHPSNIKILIDKQTFLTQHDLDMKFTYVDDKIYDILGYQREDLLNKSVYQYHHLLDSMELAKSFKTLFSVGQCETGSYRFLAKRGGYAWVLTQATLIYVDKTQKPNYVVCINYFLSGVENEHEVISTQQLDAKAELSVSPPPPSLVVVPAAASAAAAAAEEEEEESSVEEEVVVVANISQRPSNCTAKIIVPLTDDMSKGFLMPSGDTEQLTCMNEDPDDLTHLAPTPGDECVPLTGFYDDVRLPENFYDVSLVSDLLSLKEEHLCPEKSTAFTRLENDPFLCHQQDQLNALDLIHDRLHDRSDTSSSDLSSLKSSSPAELMLGDEVDAYHMANLELGLASTALLSDHSLDTHSDGSLDRLSSLSPPPPLQPGKDHSWTDYFKQGNSSILSSMNEQKESSNLAKLLLKSEMEYSKGMKSPVESLSSSKLIRHTNGSSSNNKSNFLSCENQSKRLLSEDLTCTKKARVMCDVVSNYVSQNSVLLNLLRSGRDDSSGYSCMNRSPYSKNSEIPNYRSASDLRKSEEMMKAGKSTSSKAALGLLASEMPSMSALLSLTQHDMEVNAPLGSTRNLLHGQELLLALDQTTPGFV